MAMKWLIGYLVGYLLAPRVFVSHVISFVIFCSLAKQLDDVGQLVRTAIKHEVVQLALWLVLPAEGLAIALSLLFCLRLCDAAAGTGTVVAALCQSSTLATGQCITTLQCTVPERPDNRGPSSLSRNDVSQLRKKIQRDLR